jgi:hypothetical protein
MSLFTDPSQAGLPELWGAVSPTRPRSTGLLGVVSQRAK